MHAQHVVALLDVVEFEASVLGDRSFINQLSLVQKLNRAGIIQTGPDLGAHLAFDVAGQKCSRAEDQNEKTS